MVGKQEVFGNNNENGKDKVNEEKKGLMKKSIQNRVLKRIGERRMNNLNENENESRGRNKKRE